MLLLKQANIRLQKSSMTVFPAIKCCTDYLTPVKRAKYLPVVAHFVQEYNPVLHEISKKQREEIPAVTLCKINYKDQTPVAPVNLSLSPCIVTHYLSLQLSACSVVEGTSQPTTANRITNHNTLVHLSAEFKHFIIKTAIQTCNLINMKICRNYL